jgi:Zn-dependent protease with chaperone function
MNSPFNTTAYRYPNEGLILLTTFSLVLGVIAFTATATLCLSVFVVLLIVLLAYFSSRSHHNALILNADRISTKRNTHVSQIVQECMARLQLKLIEVYIVNSSKLNAYTFGLSNPKVVVLYSALFNIMDEDEIRFIIGHEFGHVKLGHTWLNSLVGGMAGIPSPSSASALLTMAFLWWNRTCEYSADRAGLLACNNPHKAITALIKLVAGPNALSPEGMALAYHQIDAEDDTLTGTIRESLGSHPLLINRINKLRQYSNSSQYLRLQNLVNQNLVT